MRAASTLLMLLVLLVQSLVGAPHSDIDEMRDDLEAVGLAHSYDMSRFPRIQEAMVRLDKYVQDLIAARRADPSLGSPDDVLAVLMGASDSGGVSHRQQYASTRNPSYTRPLSHSVRNAHITLSM